MPRRRIRSMKAFWFGILFLEFFCFASVDSLFNRIVTDIRIGSHTYLLERHTQVTRIVPGWPVREEGINISRRRPGGPSDVPRICIERRLPCYQLHDSTLLYFFLIPWAAFIIIRSIRQHYLTDRLPDDPDRDTH